MNFYVGGKPPTRIGTEGDFPALCVGHPPHMTRGSDGPAVGGPSPPIV
ncbi:hypothetical protein GCM10010433_69180 [Streptomyces pulveraceus]